MPKLFDNIFNGIYNAVDKGIGLPEKVFDATVRLSGRDIGPEDFFRTDSLPDRFTVFLPFAGGQLSYKRPPFCIHCLKPTDRTVFYRTAVPTGHISPQLPLCLDCRSYKDDLRVSCPLRPGFGLTNYLQFNFKNFEYAKAFAAVNNSHIRFFETVSTNVTDTTALRYNSFCHYALEMYKTYIGWGDTLPILSFTSELVSVFNNEFKNFSEYDDERKRALAMIFSYYEKIIAEKKTVQNTLIIRASIQNLCSFGYIDRQTEKDLYAKYPFE